MHAACAAGHRRRDTYIIRACTSIFVSDGYRLVVIVVIVVVVVVVVVGVRVCCDAAQQIPRVVLSACQLL